MLPPCQRLKALRDRAGVSGKECADAWRAFKDRHKLPKRGKKTLMPPAATTWYRYENVDVMGDRPIPDNVITALIPLLVGKGTPPITENELAAISESGMIDRSRVPLISDAPRGKPALSIVRPEAAPKQATQDGDVGSEAGAGCLVIQYRAERGVYLDADRLDAKTFGCSPIIQENDGEFATVIADEHAFPRYAPGTILHCVPYADSRCRTGSRVVAFAERPGNGGLGEVVVAVVESVVGSSHVLKTMDGAAVDGPILGVVKGHYALD